MLEFDSLSGACLVPCARSQGTTVEVLDLFFNAPVRKKFLKPPRSEFQAIETLVRRFALSAPHIALSLTHDAKLIFNLPAATSEEAYLDRRRKLLGKAFVDQAIFIEVEQAGMQLKAWLSDFSYQISQNDKQWVYVNQRMVKDKLLLHAVKQAYGERLFPGRYPVCLLYFNLPQQDVDVNVHPTKHELRFQQPRLVHDFICSHLTQALASSQGASMGSSLMDLGLPSPARTATGQGLSVHRPNHGQLTPWSCLQGTADDEQPLRHDLGSCLRLNALYALFLELKLTCFAYILPTRFFP
jgi:DNA mismatch repair ATPase MutL